MIHSTGSILAYLTVILSFECLKLFGTATELNVADSCETVCRWQLLVQIALPAILYIFRYSVVLYSLFRIIQPPQHHLPIMTQACGTCQCSTYMISVTTAFIPSYFTSVLHKITFKHNVLSIRVNLQPCPFFASFKCTHYIFHC